MFETAQANTSIAQPVLIKQMASSPAKQARDDDADDSDDDARPAGAPRQTLAAAATPSVAPVEVVITRTHNQLLIYRVSLIQLLMMVTIAITLHTY